MARSVKQAKKGLAYWKETFKELNWPSLEANLGLETHVLDIGY